MSNEEIIEHFEWCLCEAEDMLGAHTGGPYEEEYRQNLKDAEKALSRLKNIFSYRPKVTVEK